MNKSQANVLITTSPYTTLLYFLVSEIDDINNTKYFFIRTRKYTQQEKEQIAKIFPSSYFLKEPQITARFRNNKLLQKAYTALQLIFKKAGVYLWLRACRNLRWPFLKTSKIYAYDNVSASKALIAGSEYVFLEEGLFTYENADIYAQRASLARRLQIFLAAPFAVRGLATTKQAVKIILTGVAEIPKCYAGRNLEIVSMPELWEKSDINKQEIIMKFFSLSHEDVNALKSRKIIFVDQPLSDDGLITRDEQIEMLRKIFERYGHSQVLLKTHYRSSINYREIFPEVFIWDKLTPMELLNLCGVTFDKAVTVKSTAALSFPESVKIDWLGKNPDDECFNHLSPASRRLFVDFVNRIPLPNRIKSQDAKEN